MILEFLQFVELISSLLELNLLFNMYTALMVLCCEVV